MKNELEELRAENARLKAELEHYKNAHARGAAAANAKLTPEERSARAKKAVEARIRKYGQTARS